MFNPGRDPELTADIERAIERVRAALAPPTITPTSNLRPTITPTPRILPTLSTAQPDESLAAAYFGELVRLTQNADTERPEIRAAKQALATR